MMQSINVIRNMASFSKLQQKLTGVLRSPLRRVIFVVIVLLIIGYCMIPLLRQEGHRYISMGRLERCVADRLAVFEKKISDRNAFVYHEPSISEVVEKRFLPYIGNGYIGVSLDGKHGVWLKGDRGLDIPTDYNPIAKFELTGYTKSSVTVLDILDGKIVKTSCYQRSNNKFSPCITLSEIYLIHRTRPGLLLQQTTISNPSNDNIEISVTQQGISEWADRKSLKTLTDLPIDSSVKQEGTTWRLGSKKLDDKVFLTVAALHVATTGLLELKAKDTIHLNLMTVFDYKIINNGEHRVQVVKSQKHTEMVLKSSIKLGSESLYNEHVKQWNLLWKSGFTISESRAPDALNGDVINSTLYYIMSHVPSIINSVTSNQSEIDLAKSLLNKPESCYHNRHLTLQFSSLWQIGDTVESMNSGVDTHLKTLEKYGCTNYIQSGVEGMLQAVLLSLGGLQFVTVKGTAAHLEFNADPADLHRDYQFRSIRFSDRTELNVSVIVDDKNYLSVLHVSSSNAGFYATDAGFTETLPLQSDKMVTLPVKITKPLNAILYISDDKTHLSDMKQVVQHMEEPKLAPAHDHNIIALHKHGHSYGGLPFIFWVLLIVLLIVFHVFLIKLIIQELRKPSEPTFRRRAFS